MFRALLVLLGVLLPLLVLELGVRAFSSFTGSEPPRDDRPEFYFGAGNSPDFRDYRFFKKAKNTFRIAAVGDSFTFAPYMQFTDAYPKVLERMLNLNPKSKRAQVLNFGVPGYATSHEVYSVERALDFSSDIVLLQITLNDAEKKPLRPRSLSETHLGGFGEMNPGEFWSRVFEYSKSAEFVAQRLHNELTHRNYRDYFFELFKDPENFARFQAALKLIAEYCEKAEVPLRAVVFPLFGTELDDSYPFFQLHQLIHQELEALGIRYLDLFERYRGIPVSRLQVLPGTDRHPNEIAHRIAAESIYSWLSDSEKLIPTGLLIPKRAHQRLGLREASEKKVKQRQVKNHENEAH